MSDKAKSEIPEHIAIIMDGNGRWAKSRGLSRRKGHEAGAESVSAVIKACRTQGVKYLTLYSFSIENWVRPKAEVRALMALLEHFLKHREHELHENRVRLRALGRIEDLPDGTRKELKRVEKATEMYDEGQLILALSYGGRTEIARSAKEIAKLVAAGELDPDDIDEDTIAQHLYLPDVPDPDLLIRTSGELRISNFLLWQASYSEFYFTDTLWPDFREEQLAEAIGEYARRSRRFGDI
jgi:undecaprenyl diphosphate synthase